MLGLLNQDPPLVDHDHEHDHSAWLSGRGLDVTGEACGTQSCPVIPQYGSRSLVDELLDRPKTRSPPTQLLVPTRQSHEVPVLFREAYIENGFRAINQPWQYYVCSFFQLHNESMNVWTHFLAAYLMAKKLVVFSQYIDFWNDTYSWTFLTGLGSATLMYATSTGAHWFQSHSEFIYYLSFMLDYASIGLYSFSSVMLHYTYSADKQVYEYMRDIYQPIGAILGFLTCFCSVVGLVLLRLEYPRARKACQTIPVAFIYILLVSPILHRIYMCQIHDMECELSIDLHTQQIIWFLLSALFFVSHFPQCVLPGCFDHFFHSHQMFHVCITVSTLHQMDAVFEDFFAREEIFRTRSTPTATDVMLPFGFILLGEICTIWCFLNIANANLALEKVKPTSITDNIDVNNNIANDAVNSQHSESRQN